MKYSTNTFIKYFAVTAFVLLVTQSCQKDWLQPKPLSFFSPGTVRPKFCEKAKPAKASNEARVRRNEVMEMDGRRRMPQADYSCQSLGTQSALCDPSQKGGFLECLQLHSQTFFGSVSVNFLGPRPVPLCEPSQLG